MAEKHTYEQSVAELESTVKQLEGGDLTLDESLAAFEKGMKLTKECEALLNEAKGKVEKLVRDSEDGLKTEQFEPTKE